MKLLLYLGLSFAILTFFFSYPLALDANVGPYQQVSQISDIEFANATGISADLGLNTYVFEPMWHKIDLYNRTGHNFGTLGFGSPEQPIDGAKSGKDGKIYFADKFLDVIKIAMGSVPVILPILFGPDDPCGLDIGENGDLIVRDRSKVVRLAFPSFNASTIIANVDDTTGGQLLSCPVDESNQGIYFTRNNMIVSTNPNFHPELPSIPIPIIGDITSDRDGNVLIMTAPWEIKKLDRTGKFITGFDFEDEFFNNNTGVFWDSKIAVDSEGKVYVLDVTRGKILVFRQVDDSAQFLQPNGVAARFSDIYVADSGNNRIQKFTNNGDFINRWGHRGLSSGDFNFPSDIAVDGEDNVFATDTSNNRIQKFTNNGFFNKKWGTQCNMVTNSGCVDPDGTGPLSVGDGQFMHPNGVSVDSNGNVFVVDSRNHRVQKFTNDGLFINKWGSECNLITTSGCVDSDGPGPLSLGDGQFEFPSDIAVASDGNIFVIDRNDRVQKFTNEGIFIKKWGAPGVGNSQFNSSEGIAIAPDGDVFVADTGNNRIQKFTNNGLFLTKWGFSGADEGQFNLPSGIAVDLEGNVHVTDKSNDRIQKFTNDGAFVKSWGSLGNK